ncbi:MAG: hypothetical protein GWP14_06260 [Actinobacteria bacterium]|nr:hypothetical protein [Actinomycetota bacterium]
MSNKMIALYIAVGVALAGAVAWLVLGKTVRSRLRMEKILRNDPDINDWLIVFNWTPKILYLPTIAASVAACLLMSLRQAGWVFEAVSPEVIGGIWLVVFFVNFLIEEFEISVKLLLITLVSVGFLLLWLHLLGWVVGFLKSFRHLALSVNATGYLLVAIIGLLTIFVSWLKGLFFYVAITPNYMNLQEGPTETGEQIGREDYNSRVDTGDFLERLLGFGKILITFKDQKRQPISLLVWRIDKKAQLLEKVRGKFAIDLDSHARADEGAE